MTSVRIDKWLWAARFFKTRAMAARACDLGRILSNEQPAKPAREVRVGDMLRVSNEGGEFQVEVLLLSEVRGPAAVAQTLYRETEASREAALEGGGGAKGGEAVRGVADGQAIQTRPAENYPVSRCKPHPRRLTAAGVGVAPR